MLPKFNHQIPNIKFGLGAIRVRRAGRSVQIHRFAE
jgi:hypothetical protein